jgi:putative glutamine amidotransferase
MRPIIGITGLHDWKDSVIRQNETYVRAVEKAGGAPVLLPPTKDSNSIDSFLNVIDGLIISGGPDMGAHYFNEEPHKDMGQISPLMDEFEEELFNKALEKNIPILGICRGLQVINVFLGGTLYQDIYDQTDTKIQHRQKAPREFTAHSIEIIEDSFLYELFGDRLRVNTFHHQAIKDLGQGMEAVAYAPDGLIEAIESKDYKFLIAVQWHPEGMWNSEYNYDKLFDELVKASKNYRS